MTDMNYRNWYLIQRLERRAARPINARAPAVGGIDQIIAHDYMVRPNLSGVQFRIRGALSVNWVVKANWCGWKLRTSRTRANRST